MDKHIPGVLVLALALFTGLACPAFALDEEWDCTSGLTCETHDCGDYQPLQNDQHVYVFSAEEGLYNCDIDVETCCFGYLGETPEVNEKSDVFLNNVLVGSTDDPYCNGVEECGDYTNENDCDGAGCSWYGYTWYDNQDWVRGLCMDAPCSLFTNQGCQPGDSYFPAGFSRAPDGCCTCWVSGWCGNCSGPGNECSVKIPKYCHDIGYGDCQGFGPGDVQCTWDDSHTVLAGLGTDGGMPDDNGVVCSDIGTNNEKYANLLGFYHFQDPTELNYICCFAQNLENGMYCITGGECASGNCQNNACTSPVCDNDGNCEPGQGETHANCPSDCECDTNSECGSGEVCCSHACYAGECCDDYDCDVDQTCQDYYCTMVETHKECMDYKCEDVTGSGEDDCQDDKDCGALSGGGEMETDAVHFGLYLNLFNVFNPYGNDRAGTGGTTLSFASSGCLRCNSVTKIIELDGVGLIAANRINLSAQDSHGLKRLSISCDRVYPPVADAGDDQTVELTYTYVTVDFSGLGSSDSDGTILTYHWDFGDGYSGYGDSADGSTSHDYYSEGRYTVTLTVTDDDGLTHSDTLELAVNDMPTITDDYAYDGVWVNADQTVNLDAQDPSSIIKGIKYCQGVDCDPANGQAITSSPTISFTQDINQLIRYKAWDTYDNPSDIGQFTVKIDKTAPVTTDDSDTNVHGDNYGVTLTCSDDGSGCDETYYCVSGSGSTTCNPTTLGTSAVVNCEAFSYCEKVIVYYSTDNLGNQESAVTSNVIKIDTRIPACEMTQLDSYTTSEDVSLSWYGTDPGGGTITGYKIWYRDGSGSWNVWNTYDGSVVSGTFTGEDGHSYDFRCQSITVIYSDGGSQSASVSTFIDTTSPTASLGSLPLWTGQESFQVSWSGQDSGSGVKDYDVEYGTDGENWNTWLTDTGLASGIFGDGDPVDVSDGETYHFRVSAGDNAGLQGGWSGIESTSVDLAGPACSVGNLPEYVTESSLTISWSGQDSGSGVKDYDVEYGTDGENWTSFETQTTEASITANLMDRKYCFRCRARDVVDNEGEWSGSESVTVDTRAPVETLVSYESRVLAGGNITVNATLSDASDIVNVTLVYDNTIITEHERIEVSENTWNLSWTFRASGSYGSDEFIIVTGDMHGNSRNFRHSFDIVLCEEGEVRICGTDVGECRKGNQTCVDGMWGECLGGLEKTPEVCDGKDNDCDGEVDNGIQCTCVPGNTRKCGMDTGECVKGIQTCAAEQEWGPCGGNYAGPQPEVCDGKDNDCDGRIDNGANCCPEGKRRPCGFSNAGICEFGESLCRNGVWEKCRGGVLPKNEICDNGLDDDCDGETDEGCDLCNNNVQDEGEDGVDCGGPCEPCPEFPWIILSIVGVVILVVLLVIWKMFKSGGEELTWETLKERWS